MKKKKLTWIFPDLVSGTHREILLLIALLRKDFITIIYITIAEHRNNLFCFFMCHTPLSNKNLKLIHKWRIQIFHKK